MSQEITANTYGGTADYLLPGEPHPRWLVQAFPEIEKLREAWLEANEEGRKIYKTSRRAAEEVARLRKAVATQDATKTEQEAAENYLRKEEDKVRQAAYAAKRKLHTYNEAAWKIGMEARLPIAGAEALAAHAKVAAALDVLEAEIPTLLQAWTIAGTPGRDPRKQNGADFSAVDGGMAFALKRVRHLASIDTAALQSAMTGERVMTAREHEQLDQALATNDKKKIREILESAQA